MMLLVDATPWTWCAMLPNSTRRTIFRFPLRCNFSSASFAGLNATERIQRGPRMIWDVNESGTFEVVSTRLGATTSP
jgi:hypothetical protein